MLPLKDDIPARGFPAMTLALIGVNVLAFFHELSLGQGLEEFLLKWGLVPLRYTNANVAQYFSLPEQTFAFLSSMFLHGGWTHLIGNMWTLWIFGDNVEDRLGRWRYLTLYLASGIIAAWLQILANAHSGIPTIGASGAVAGVMGAYFWLFPHARVTTLIPPFFLGPFFVLPAVFFLGWWFLLQFFSGSMSLLANPQLVGGIAWWAHVGGFAFGLAAAFFISTRQNATQTRWPDEV
jgi:membrane associated rhomboid family serine protease